VKLGIVDTCRLERGQNHARSPSARDADLDDLAWAQLLHQAGDERRVHVGDARDGPTGLPSPQVTSDRRADAINVARRELLEEFHVRDESFYGIGL
jgi:hypothetical protein